MTTIEKMIEAFKIGEIEAAKQGGCGDQLRVAGMILALQELLKIQVPECVSRVWKDGAEYETLDEGFEDAIKAIINEHVNQ